MSRAHRAGGRGGFTLVEVLAASAIGAVVTGGTLMAFVTAARLTAERDDPSIVEASGFAQQTIERFRNRIACDDVVWFDASCQPLDIPGRIQSAPGAWTPDPFVNSGGGNYPLGSLSILDVDGDGAYDAAARRCYRAWQVDCDGDGTDGDCYAFEAQVCWRDATGCTCPPMT